MEPKNQLCCIYMESPKTKIEIIKPIFLKAGIPLALSVVGLICARIISRRSLISKASESGTHEDFTGNGSAEEFGDEDSFISLHSAPLALQEDKELMIAANAHCVEFSGKLEILGLRSQTERLQERERELEMRFFQYCDLKEQEAGLVKLQNMLTLEITRIELFDREILFMEAVMVDFATGIFRVLEHLELLKTENELLHRRARKLTGKMRKQSQALRKLNLRIEARETEILTCREELKRRNSNIKTLEDESREKLKVINQLQSEKDQLLNKLELAEKSTPQNSNDICISPEDYNPVLREQEQLQKERATELKELIHPRWSSACLRRDLMIIHEQAEGKQNKENQYESEVEGKGATGSYSPELNGSVSEHAGTCLAIKSSSHSSPKKLKLLPKLKRRWVEGRGKIKGKAVEKGKIEAYCFGRHSVLEGIEEQHNDGRWSCSSA